MSLYSLDSLESVACHSDNGESSESCGRKTFPTVSSSSTNRGAADAASETRELVVKPNRSETRNPLIAIESLRPGPQLLEAPRSTPDESLSSGTRQASLPSVPTNTSLLLGKKNAASKFKNDKKLSSVLQPPDIVDANAKPKPKTYLQRYREGLGLGAPTKKHIVSPEGSTLSIYGDSTYEPITEVDSRPGTRTPRDDQSELSFYRCLINQPRTTRSCGFGNRCMANGDLRSVSDCGLASTGGRQRVSYRPYSIRDYECLTVPRADRSLGPDPVEIREKWEKLMRRTRYGDSASSRNRQNVVRRSELRKCKRTNFQKHTVEFSLPEDTDAAGQLAESKNFGDTLLVPGRLNYQKTPPRPPQGRKKAPRRQPRFNQIPTTTDSIKLYPNGKSLESLIRSSEENIEDYSSSSLDDLQRRHQNEKRVMDLLINRTLLR